VALVALAAGVVGVAVWSLTRQADNPAEVPDSLRPPAAPPAAASPLPEGSLVYDSDRTGSFELYAAAVDGAAAPRRLTDDGRYDSWGPRLSPDRRTVVFSRTPAGTHDDDPAATSLWAVGADGTGLAQLRAAGTDGWAVQGSADWSPDGTRLVMHGGRRADPQVFVTDAVGGSPRAVTARRGPNVDPSWAPDGSAIVFAGCPDDPCEPADREVYRVPVEGGDAVRLTDDDRADAQPRLSPDGTLLLWRRHTRDALEEGWDLVVAGADGTGPRVLVGGEGSAGGAWWAAGGGRVLLHRLLPAGGSANVWTVAADGTDLRAVTASGADTNEYPTG
jgi:hypothetical protein